ncbi:hypothetical protein B296_00026707 [Ensete ventricosum]|uniref:Uncharacterized protein n=1 Tax=Ensete ventricosum TaxID=4639 RepID=A0A426YEE6_ENSVE|nr:hypothetical protein B296_00026707 [Ensete ventricosum]
MSVCHRRRMRKRDRGGGALTGTLEKRGWRTRVASKPDLMTSTSTGFPNPMIATMQQSKPGWWNSFAAGLSGSSSLALPATASSSTAPLAALLRPILIGSGLFLGVAPSIDSQAWRLTHGSGDGGIGESMEARQRPYYSSLLVYCSRGVQRRECPQPGGVSREQRRFSYLFQLPYLSLSLYLYFEGEILSSGATNFHQWL